jgi:two-component system sensor histidine kinase KdpD
VSIKVQDNLPLVKMDFGLMEQALSNLLYNAAVYTPSGTSILVDANVEGGDCVISVADNGPGLTQDVLPKVFDKFYRAPGAKTGGTGLGLPIVKGFVEAHGGTISARNRSAGGSEFVIRIPLNSESSKAGTRTL